MAKPEYIAFEIEWLQLMTDSHSHLRHAIQDIRWLKLEKMTAYVEPIKYSARAAFMLICAPCSGNPSET